MTAKYGFKMIWESINGKESWNKNPFVFVYEFEQIENFLIHSGQFQNRYFYPVLLILSAAS